MSSKKHRSAAPANLSPTSEVPISSAPAHAIADAKFKELIGTLWQLRRVRDEKLYLNDGFHTFREWTMAFFGERLGAWIEETI